MRPLKTILGSYMPAFFRMDLSFSFPGGERAYEKINEKEVSVFIHEYIHFIQDITTYIGYNNLYVYSEYLHGAVNEIYKKSPGNIHLPITFNNNYGNINLNRFVNKETCGDIEEENEFFLTKITFEEKEVPYRNQFVSHIKKVKLHSAKGKIVDFGYRAIMESMAYLIEKQITRGSSIPPDFPYLSAEMIVKEYYEEFGENPLRIIALCDASLQFSEPAKIFIESLKEFKKTNFNPENANDVIDYFYNKKCVQMGNPVDLTMGIINMGFMVGERLKLYMNNASFKPFHDVIHTTIGFGISQRIKNRYFILDIVRNGYALTNPLLRKILLKVGTPIIKDINDDFWMIPPIGKNPSNYWLEYFPAVEAIYNTIANGFDICELFNWCEKSPHTIEDERCINEPWKRVGDKSLCPYAMLWKHWNLSSYIPNIKSSY
ncbi:hypothetical protein [Hoylesella timonensis]|jgi:hypothetical protein|uniref:Uncharacterized protein n=1 Tax=Hoylesella timonensis S9-PR14 TaxID=1401062 RepID=A0A098YNB1_9BACT|nr:hypothetical protein [Hoylesella timonensis]KGI21235.1 hypothetical protein HMPREF9304_11455 [Hoylesella timonensis S9-PR14]